MLMKDCRWKVSPASFTLVFCVLCRQKVCCGIIYKGRFGEVLIDPHLFKPCCRKKQRQQQQQEEEEEEEEEDEEEEVEVEEGQVGADVEGEKPQVEEEVKEIPTCEEDAVPAQLCVTMTTPPTRGVVVAAEAGW